MQTRNKNKSTRNRKPSPDYGNTSPRILNQQLTINRLTARINKRFALEIGQLESRLKMIGHVTAWRWNGPGKVHDAAVLHARTHARELVRENKLCGPAGRDTA